MLGFRPADSLVAIALCGPRERMGFSLRLDLPTERDGDEVFDATVAEVARRMLFAKADAVMLFIYTDAPADGCLPHRSLVDAVELELGAPLREAALVSDDRMWSYVCDDRRCCPPEGRLIDRGSPDAVKLAAEHAALGSAVLGSRDELIASMRPIGGIAAESMRQAQDRASDAMFDVGPVLFASAVEKEIDELVRRFEDPRASLGDDEAARVVIALGDKLLRDQMLVRLSDPDEQSLRLALTAVARRAQPPDDAPVCTLVGFAHYVDGSGLPASVAFDRALQSEPDYVMARYLDTMLQHQVSPEEVRACGVGAAGQVGRLSGSRRRRRG